MWTNAADGRGLSAEGKPIGPTVADALMDLPDAEQFEELNETDEIGWRDWLEPSMYAKEMRCLTNNAWHKGHIRNWEPNLLTSSARTNHTDISRTRFAKTTGGETEPISRFYKLSLNGLSNTLRAGTDGARGAFTSPRPIHPVYNRCITVREMARLHGYPDWFRFNETKWHGARQIGNSVPPPLARAIGSEVFKCLRNSKYSIVETISLGDTNLLRMTVSKAADHFDIEAPAQKRDRKSGTKKRKQAEIESEMRDIRVANG